MKHKEIILRDMKDSISHFNMSDLITVIGNSCFEGSNLVNIKFSKNLKIIERLAFYECFNLRDINFTNCINLSEINESVFCDCHSLKEIYIPDGVKLGKKIFWDCVRLERVRLPNDLEIISDSLFRDCRKLTSINIPNSVVEIGDYAFYGSDIKEINIISKKVKISKQGHENIKIIKL